MSFDWREYLELAQALTAQAGSGYSKEAAKRSAISRAYYAAFCWARNYAEANWGFQRTATAEDHGRLREHLRRQRRMQLASDLNKLRGWRNACDYDDKVPSLDQFVQSAIRIADKIIQECR